LTFTPLQPEQKPIIKSGGIIEPFFIQNQGVGERADFQEMMPIAGIAREPRDFQPQNQPHLSESDFSYESLEAQAISRRGSRMAQILINDDDSLIRPAQCSRSVAQGILAGSTLGILKDLLQRTLTDIQTCQSSEMISGDLLTHISDPPDLKSADPSTTLLAAAGL